ncbi:unnamed protein product [Parnassius apollo]|uniref:(apollo) hypothetical protein n=1 Tax=Parnassius apollo TaxID=110799 RepID=A0A8S3W5W0_PARAO|nr:unnamed protein product [Parnassius apollo]
MQYFDFRMETYQLCSENEEFKVCGSACPPTCSQPEPDACISVCRMGCFCKSGYYRDESTNECVKQDQCSEIAMETYQLCSENEEFKICGSACPPTCSQPEPDACIPVCRMGCFCKSGYYRDENTNKCVKRDQCSKISSTTYGIDLATTLPQFARQSAWLDDLSGSTAQR